jgi:hypothetical protein
MAEELKIGKDGEQGESQGSESAEGPDRPLHGRKTKGHPLSIARRHQARLTRDGSDKGGSKNTGGTSSGGGKRKKKNWYKNSGKK